MPTEPRPCVVITTYSRPDGLDRLLDDLEREWPPGGLDVRVFDDATPNPDAGIERRLGERGWSLRRAAANHGKLGWWRWWNAILADLHDCGAERFFFLQDDMRLCERFFDRASALWTAIDDPAKASLFLHLTAQRAALGERCWTPVRAERAGDVVRCGWVDCAAFYCERRLFDALDWRLAPVEERRWHGGEHVSSGVGQQLSLRAHARGLGLYRVGRSLTVHDGGPSLMNAAARQRWPMDTVHFVDGDAAAGGLAMPRPHVLASLASVPGRERGLRRVVASLLGQVDALAVYLNGYERVPPYLEDERIEVVRSAEHGDRADAGKFFWAGTTRGHHLVCDDDIDYPDDYVARLVEGIERHGRRAVVGFHGRLLPDDIADYHRSSRLLHFTRALATDRAVHVLGTGVCGYHAAALAVRPEDFPAPRMADIWLALLGQRRRVPFVCLARPEGWLRELDGLGDDSIYARARARAGATAETRAVREYGRWTLRPAPGPAGPSPPAPTRRPVRRRPHPPPRARRARPLARVQVSGPGREATLVLPERDHITEAVRRSGTYYERDLLDAIRARGARGTYVDVGAHHGNHTAFFAIECDAERVIAIEPNPAAHAGLLETIAENGLRDRVAARRVAVHPQWRRVAVTALPWRASPSAAGLNSGRVGVVPAAGAGPGDAPAAPLDEILDGVDAIAVVKVDTESSSREVLASGTRMLRRELPLVAAVAASDAERGALRSLLSSLGYREVAPSFGWTPTWLWEPPARIPAGLYATRYVPTTPTN